MRATTGAAGRSAVRGASGVLAGGGSSRRAASSARSGRTGRVRVERPAVTVRVTGSGAGHAMGQRPVAIATRMRLPAAKRWALSLSRRCTVIGAPGARGVTRSCVSSWVRLRRPKLTRATAPSACTSERRALTWATGRSLATSRVTTGAPRKASGFARGSVSKQSETASSARWSTGHSGLPSPFFSQMGLVLPMVAGDAIASGRSGPGPSSSPSGLRCQVRPGSGGSATSPPPPSPPAPAPGPRRAGRCRASRPGSSARPLSRHPPPTRPPPPPSPFPLSPPPLVPLSHRSHHRRLSVRKPIAGPGLAWCGYWCPHGPTRALRGTSRCSISRNTGLV